VLIPDGMISARIEKMAADIYKHMQAKDIKAMHVIILMNGALVFFNMLFSHLKKLQSQESVHRMITWQFVKITSYAGMKSGEVQGLEQFKASDIEGKHLLVLEDIYGTGNSLSVIR